MGLFGQSVDEVQQAQEAQRQGQALQIAQLTNGQLTNYNGALTGGMIADGLRSAFNVPNTQMDNANKLQSIQAETEQEAPFDTDPLRHMQLAISKLMQYGLQTEAANAMAHYKEYAGAQSQQQTAQANLINAQKGGTDKVKSVSMGSNGMLNILTEGGVAKQVPVPEGFQLPEQNTGSAPSLIQYQNARDNLNEALKQDPKNQAIINKIREINKIIPTLGHSAQFVIGSDGTVYSGDKKTGSFGLAGQGTQQQQMPQGQQQYNAPTYQGNDLSAEDMQRLQNAAKMGNQDAVAALTAYAQFKGQPDNTNADGQPPALPNPIRLAAKASLAPSTIDTLSFNTLITGKSPSGLSRGYKGQTSPDMAAVLNRTTEMQSEMGLSDQDLMAVRLHYDTAKPALTQLQKVAQPMQAFENTLLINIDRFQEIAKTLGTTDSRWVNIPILELMQNTGNTDISKLNVRLKALQAETAKIMSGSMGNTPLSDYAQKEQEILTDKNMSLGEV